MFAKVKKIVQENNNVKTIILEPEEKLDFTAGQFMMIYTMVGIDSKRKTGRAYSIASSPSEDLMITFKLYDDGKVSPFLWNLIEGEEIEIEYPYGHFKLEDYENVVLIGAGTGIAPIRSMAFQCMENRKPFNLLCSFRGDENVIFRDDLRKMNAEIVLTTERDRIGKEDLLKFDKNSTFYICGSPEMATDIENKLKDIGIPNENIKTEKW